MCRNIRVLHNFKPPTTEDEIHAAALQYVRKVAGIAKMSKDQAEAVEQAVKAVAAATTELLATLPVPQRAEPRTRENEKLRAKLKWQTRETRIRTKAVATG